MDFDGCVCLVVWFIYDPHDEPLVGSKWVSLCWAISVFCMHSETRRTFTECMQLSCRIHTAEFNMQLYCYTTLAKGSR
jgi:hypothetical protein